VTAPPPCPTCGYAATTEPAAVVALVRGAPQRFEACFATVDPARAGRRPAPDVWPPVAYLWHVVDVLRFGAERLWMLTLDPTSTVVPWDADEVAGARGYDRLSVPVGVRALHAARDVWLDAYAATPPDATAHHPEIGPMTAAVMAHRNAHEVVHHAHDVAMGLGAPHPRADR
jgi:hypothetical protein